MRKLIALIAFSVLAGTLAVASPRQDRDDRRDQDERHDNGKHKGWDKHQDEDGDRHDNGKHKGWDKQDVRGRDAHRDWNDDHDRIRPGRHYPYGRYEHVKHSFVSVSIDYRTRRVVLYDRSNWVVAPYDVDRCRDWQWNRDAVYVYDDDRHPGWYLLFNARLGRYVHVEYFGVR
jgi:hypothetical protein